MARKRLTRKKVNDPVIDTALRDIYDKLDAIQPEVAGKTSKLSPQIGDIQLVETPSGETVMSSYTEDGWMVDMNSNYTPVSDSKGFQPALGTHGKSRTPIQGEALKYNRNKNVPISNDKKEQVLLKNISNELHVRNASDTADAKIKAKTLKLTTTDAFSALSQEVGALTYSTDDNGTHTLNTSGLNVTPVYSDVDLIPSTVIVTSNIGTDARLAFREGALAKWVMGHDANKTTTFTQTNCVKNGTNTITYPDGETFDAQGSIGALVTGTGIPDNTYVATTNTIANSFTINNDAEDSLTSTLTFTMEDEQFKINTGGSLADSSKFTLDTSGNLTLAGNITNTLLTVNATTNTTPTTISGGDTLTIAAASPITTTATSDGVVTIGWNGSMLVNYVTSNADDTMTGSYTINKDHSTTTNSSTHGLQINLEHDATPSNYQSINNYGLDIDVDFTGNSTNNSTLRNYGINMELNSNAESHGSNANIYNYGMKGVLTGNTGGTHNQTGIDLTITGADLSNQIGILLNAEDGSTDLKIVSSADTGDYFSISTTTHGATTLFTDDDNATAAHLTLDIDGDIILDSHTGITHFRDAGDTDDAFKITVVGGTGATTLETVSDGADGHLKVVADGDITLNAGTGNFIAQKAGTEFSAANSAYAGMILGYTDIGLNEADASLNLTASYVVPTDEFCVTFTAPPSGNVEIYIQISFNAGSSGAGDLFAGLSTANNTTGYASLAAYHEEELVDQSGRMGWETVVNSWTLTGLIAGSSYQYWVGFKSTSTTGTPSIKWGGDAANEYSDFIMKAIALPASIST